MLAPNDLMAKATNILKRELTREEFLHFQDLLDSGHANMFFDLVTEQAEEMAPELFVQPTEVKSPDQIVDYPGQPPDFSDK